MEQEILECLADELIKVREQLEDFNVINFEKLLVTISETNRHLKKIADSLELQSNN